MSLALYTFPNEAYVPAVAALIWRVFLSLDLEMPFNIFHELRKDCIMFGYSSWLSPRSREFFVKSWNHSRFLLTVLLEPCPSGASA